MIACQLEDKKLADYWVQKLFKHSETYKDPADKIYVNQVDKINNNAMHYAAIRGNKRVLKYLIEDNKADITLRNEDNELPIDYCKDIPELVTYLNSQNMFVSSE